ncbi:MAG: hypothetical protein LBD99_00430, partial [Candidatus Margulisbacteria bacterium]|nr:hypothetical protein [Candidatus Margulisiibacteriota bacterium]
EETGSVNLARMLHIGNTKYTELLPVWLKEIINQKLDDRIKTLLANPTEANLDELKAIRENLPEGSLKNKIINIISNLGTASQN